MDPNLLSTFQRPGMAGDDDGLSSLSAASDADAGFFQKPPPLSPSYSGLRSSHGGFPPPPYTPSSARLYDPTPNSPRHFLESCFLCGKQLAKDSDIFMYRGDTPFCSEECREEQMVLDESKPLKLSYSRKEDQKSTAHKNHNFHGRTGTVTAA